MVLNTRFKYDVFLSHKFADKPQVQRLAERMWDARLRVWFDELVVKPGDYIYLAIEREPEVSRTLVLCLSPAALGSDWVGLERSNVLFHGTLKLVRYCANSAGSATMNRSMYGRTKIPI